MALISIIKDFHPLANEKLLSRAEQLKPSLRHSIREPIGGFQLKERYSPEKHEIVLHQLPHLSMGKGENLCLDFGEHLVGYLTLELSYTGSHPDAPAFLRSSKESGRSTPRGFKRLCAWASCQETLRQAAAISQVLLSTPKPSRLILLLNSPILWLPRA